jgi:uncharacterized protein
LPALLPDENPELLADSQGHPDAAYSLGWLLYDRGQREEATRLLAKASRNGHADAMEALVTINRLNGRQEEATEAVAAWREAADAGYPGAAYFLGRFLKAQGDLRGAKSRFTTAKEGFKREMELSNRDAFYFYGRTCLEEDDEVGALSALMRAARLGHQDAPRLVRAITSRQLAPPS